MTRKLWKAENLSVIRVVKRVMTHTTLSTHPRFSADCLSLSALCLCPSLPALFTSRLQEEGHVFSFLCMCCVCVSQTQTRRKQRRERGAQRVRVHTPCQWTLTLPPFPLSLTHPPPLSLSLPPLKMSSCPTHTLSLPLLPLLSFPLQRKRPIRTRAVSHGRKTKTNMVTRTREKERETTNTRQNRTRGRTNKDRTRETTNRRRIKDQEKRKGRGRKEATLIGQRSFSCVCVCVRVSPCLSVCALLSRKHHRQSLSLSFLPPLAHSTCLLSDIGAKETHRALDLIPGCAIQGICLSGECGRECASRQRVRDLSLR